MTVQVVQMFAPTVLTTSAATLYTLGGATTSILGRARIRFANTSASSVSVTAYAVPLGGTAGVGNDFCPAQSIAAGAFLDVDVPVIVEGGFIQALASAGTAVTAFAMDGVVFS